MVTRAPAGAASSRSRRLDANTRMASCSAASHNRIRRSTLRWTWILVRHAQRTVSVSQRSPGRPRSAIAKRCMILSSYGLTAAGVALRRLGQHLQIEDFFLFAAKHRQDSMRRQFGERLAEVEIVLELLALGLLARAHRGRHQAARPHRFAQAADQVGVLGETLDQNGARAFERSFDIGHLFVGVDERRGHGLRIVFRLRQQQVGQRLQARFLGDLGLGAALRLERKIDVFQAALAVGRQNGRLQRGVQLALLADGIRESRPGALPARAGSSGALPACAIAHRRGRR